MHVIVFGLLIMAHIFCFEVGERRKSVLLFSLSQVFYYCLLLKYHEKTLLRARRFFLRLFIYIKISFHYICVDIFIAHILFLFYFLKAFFQIYSFFTEGCVYQHAFSRNHALGHSFPLASFYYFRLSSLFAFNKPFRCRAALFSCS